MSKLGDGCYLVGTYDGTLRNGAVFAPGAGISGGAISLKQVTEANVDVGNNFSFADLYFLWRPG